MTTRARNWLRNFLRSGQKGFTLIEMLVVISILGILAAVVTMSMVGVTKLAQTHANDTELKTVQVALDAMAAQQQLDATAVCPSPQPSPTSDMSQFPVPSVSAPPGSPIQLYPHYLHQPSTSKNYTCDSNGVVHQS